MLENYAFISYSTEDTDEAVWLKKVLVENGIKCWMAPDSIPGGSSYADEIDDAINECTVFVLVLSDNAQQSKWVKKELDRAINTGKLVLPFMIENTQLEKAFNFYLTDVQRYAAFESKVSAVEKMVKHIQAVMGVSSEAPVEVTALVSATPSSDNGGANGENDSDLNFESLYKDAKSVFDKVLESDVMKFIYKFTPYKKAESCDSRVKYALNSASIGWGIATLISVFHAIFSNVLTLVFIVALCFGIWHGLFFLCQKLATLPLIQKNYKVLAPIVFGVGSYIITQVVLGIVPLIF